MIEFVDSKLKYINILGVFLFANFFYFNAFSKMHNSFRYNGYRAMDCTLVVITAIIAIKIINEAGEIPIINNQILSVMNESPLDESSISHRIAFVLLIQQGVCLTVGGMVSVNKGWSLILIGTVITYSLLIKTL